MQTRILLHGGNSTKASDKNEAFYREIIDGVQSDTVRVLCVYFARPKHRWDDSYEEDQYIFRRIDTDKEVETKLASDDIDEFIADVAQSDVVFINGGMKGSLKEILLSIGLDQFRHMLAGKTLVGISAGANILSKYYYSMVIDGVREGTGLLGIKLLTHYSEDEPGQLAMLSSYPVDLPVITIREEEYIVIGGGA